LAQAELPPWPTNPAFREEGQTLRQHGAESQLAQGVDHLPRSQYAVEKEERIKRKGKKKRGIASKWGPEKIEGDRGRAFQGKGEPPSARRG
jgi:hypothetical protein